MGSSSLLAYIGTYSVRGSAGIYAVRLDGASGRLGPPEPAIADPGARVRSPTFLALNAGGSLLFASCEGRGMVSSLRVDPSGGGLTPIRPPEPFVSKPPCHVALDRTGSVVMATNYHASVFGVMPILADGGAATPFFVEHRGGGPHPVRQVAAHPHSIHSTPDNRFAVVCDLGMDRISSYPLDAAKASVDPARAIHLSTRPGIGPRHLAWSRDGSLAYVINELDNTIDSYGLDAASGALTHRQTVSTLPPGVVQPSIAAEIQVRSDGRFLYASNRGHDSLAVFAIEQGTGALSLVETVPCGGAAPRHFGLSPDGLWLICGHHESDTLCSFSIDPDSGRLTRIPGTVAVPSPVCVVFSP